MQFVYSKPFIIDRNRLFVVNCLFLLQADLDSKLSDAGEKLVIIDFFAVWCGPCKMISPKLDDLAKESSDIVILKVDGSLIFVEGLLNLTKTSVVEIDKIKFKNVFKSFEQIIRDNIKKKMVYLIPVFTLVMFVLFYLNHRFLSVLYFSIT